MALIFGNATVPSNSTVQVFTVPAGTAGTLLFQTTPSPAPVYIGGPNVSSTIGMQVPTTPLWIERYVTAGATAVYATTGNATASSFQYVISTGQ